MAVISNIFPTYTYVCFDEQDQLQIKELNVFQKYIARNLLGFYKETHLAAAVSRAYTLTLNGSLSVTDDKKQQLLRLFERADEYRHPLEANKTLPNIRYRVEKVEERYALKGIEFQTTHHRNPYVSDVEIRKEKASQALYVTFRGSRHSSWGATVADIPESMLGDDQNAEALALNRPLIQTLAGSSQCNALFFRTESYCHDTEVNHSRDQVIKRFGWGLRSDYINDGKSFRIYELTRQIALDKLKGHAFSLDFAFNLMQPS